jgi:adenine-specific DNA glycosylase
VQPRCELCPVAPWCKARELRLQATIPVKRSKPAASIVEQPLLIIRRSGKLLCWQRPSASRRMPGFWELPEIAQVPLARLIRSAGEFRHTIVNTSYHITVWEASIRATPPGLCWIALRDVAHLPLSTIARKALGRLTK